jgi:hypothetical protein
MAGGGTISTSETRAEALQLQSSAQGVTIPVVHGTARVAGNLVDYQDFRAVAHTTEESSGGKGGGPTMENTTYTYTVSLVMGLCAGPVTNVTRIWRGKKTYYSLGDIGATLLHGNLGQAMWSPLTTINGGAHALAYSGLACVAAQDYSLGSSAQVENHNFELVMPSAYEYNGLPDAVPSTIAFDWLTNPVFGGTIDSGVIGDMAMYSAYCKCANLLLSPALTEQATLAERIKTLCDLTNSQVVMADEQLHFVPLGDEPMTGVGVTYTPDLTPIYDLTPDHFLADSGQSPIRIKRKTPADAYNCVRVEYRSRDQDYNTAIAEAKDIAAISLYGLRVAPTVDAKWCCNKGTANTIAQLRLKQYLYVLNTYEFALPWSFARLLPTNLVTLTDPAEQLDRAPVRITTITEDDGGFKIEASEFPHSVSAHSSYPLQVSDGFKHDYNVAPGSVQAPAFIEPPVELTTTGLEVWVAVAGLSSAWGGCHVWVSMDGTNYKKLTTVYGGARYGTLSAAATASDGTLAVQLVDTGKQLLSGSAADAAALNTLCWVRQPGAAPEFFAYAGATLVGAGAYNLGGLVRGAFDSGASVHTSGSQFARIDQAIIKSEPLQPSMIGQTLRFKFVSFNIYGGGLEDISTVTEYTYRIAGEMALLPPANVASFTVATQADGTRQFTWGWGTGSKPADLQGYVLRYLQGAGPYTWEQLKPFDTDDGFHTSSPVESNLLLAGAYVFGIKTIDKFGVLAKDAVFIDATLPDPRLGNAIEFADEHASNWPGTLSGCVRDVWEGDQILRADDQATWATLPATWAAWTRWVWDPVTSFTYTTQVVDLGTTVAVLPVANAVADGVVTFEIATSADGTTWSAWASVAGPVLTRYIKSRVTVALAAGSPSGPGVTPIATLRRLTISYIGKVSTETGNDVSTAGFTGVHRIAAGDVRLPTQKVWAHISRVTVTLQGVGAGWDWVLIDKDGTNGPRINIHNGSGALSDALIDFTIEGIAA